MHTSNPSPEFAILHHGDPLKMARIAASLERDGEHKEAFYRWKEASRQLSNPSDVEWANRRAQFCRKWGNRLQ